MYFDKRLPQDYEDILIQMGAAPHCDAAVLHSPGECEICDPCVGLMEYRLTHGINFTGVSDPSKEPCFSERYRDIKMIYRWVGNRPKPPQRPFHANQK